MWNKVRELVGEESLSEIVATALQQVIITMECATEGFKDVELEVGEWSAGHLVKFQGHELARARDGHQIAYLTPKGKILIECLGDGVVDNTTDLTIIDIEKDFQ